MHAKTIRFSRALARVSGCLVVCSLINAPAYAEVLVRHEGSALPLEQCWLLGGDGIDVAQGAVSDDGVDAWFIDDNSEEGGSTLAYRWMLTQEQADEGNSIGWTLAARLRIVELPDGPLIGAPSGSPGISYRDGTTLWQVHFGSQDSADPAALLLTDCCTHNTNGILIPLDDAGYHLFELVYDPAGESVSVCVDGLECASGWQGFPWTTANPHVVWGAFSTADTGHANFNLVQFAIGNATIDDCNGNGILDACDILQGTSEDANGNGIPDECECPEDVNGDGTVNTSDLLIVLAQWGTAGPLGDVNFDQTVNTEDLLLVLGAWGECE